MYDVFCYRIFSIVIKLFCVTKCSVYSVDGNGKRTMWIIRNTRSLPEELDFIISSLLIHSLPKESVAEEVALR